MAVSSTGAARARSTLAFLAGLLAFAFFLDALRLLTLVLALVFAWLLRCLLFGSFNCDDSGEKNEGGFLGRRERRKGDTSSSLSVSSVSSYHAHNEGSANSFVWYTNQTEGNVQR